LTVDSEHPTTAQPYEHSGIESVVFVIVNHFSPIGFDLDESHISLPVMEELAAQDFQTQAQAMELTLIHFSLVPQRDPAEAWGLDYLREMRFSQRENHSWNGLSQENHITESAAIDLMEPERAPGSLSSHFPYTLHESHLDDFHNFEAP
jgi:hypothetical protein